ncbi:MULTISPECIES: hypothetical protein [unclassified Streptomyces]|uniref:hypothetical protein n=1 Tax=unclassified Streptomyces TaxID=2593676 RepID=UPI0013714D77|nr:MULTISPECIES: hypothetical protein [unclassified Streptomyces]MYY84096.1 hypothetical protein [Streptomyces sp. SID335]MYZ18394.1 hypothetical protein [Streptomyces sp. SID337]NEB42853.1 hypothetical protein [Streptomyces sp. SID339]
MESTELAMLAVGVVTAVATGAATGVGEGAGAAVTELVRSRLGRTERGRAALAGIDGDAQAQARAVLREEIEADPEFGRQLALYLSAPTTYNRGAVVIGDSTITRSNISLGPISVRKTSGALAVLALVGVLLVALVALGVYGGTRLIADDDPRGTDAPGSAASGGKAAPEEGRAAGSGDGTADRTRALTVAQTRGALPVEGDLPPGWHPEGPAGAAEAEQAGGCHEGGMQYALTSSGSGYVKAEFRVFGCTSPTQAERVRKQLVREQSGYDRTTPLSLPSLGDKSSTFTYYKEPEDSTNAMAVVRVGSTVAWLRLGEVNDLPGYEAQLDELARAFVGRIERTLADS